MAVILISPQAFLMGAATGRPNTSHTFRNSPWHASHGPRSMKPAFNPFLLKIFNSREHVWSHWDIWYPKTGRCSEWQHWTCVIFPKIRTGHWDSRIMCLVSGVQWFWHPLKRGKITTTCPDPSGTQYEVMQCLMDTPLQTAWWGSSQAEDACPAPCYTMHVLIS